MFSLFGLFLVLPLVIIIIAGNILRARGFYSANDISALMKTLYWVVLPPLLYYTTYQAGAEALNQPRLFAASMICYVATVIVALVGAVAFVHKGNTGRIAVSVMACFRSNNVYLGFPVIQLAMGEAGLHQASICLAVTMVGYQFISLGAGEIFTSGRLSLRSVKSICKKLVTNPLLVSCVFGVSTAMVGIHLHFVIEEVLKIMSGAATAIALLALGGSLDLSRVNKIIGILRRTWYDTVIKMVICPAIMYVLLMFFKVPEPLFRVSVMLTAMPTAINTFIIARGMGMDSDYAADLVASATLTGIVAIPAWAYILHMV